MSEKIRAVVKRGNIALGYLSGLGILTMGSILFYEVIVRYFFNTPTIWVQEVSVYLFMWTMLVGASYTLMLGKHVRIDLVFDRLPFRMQCMLDVVTGCIGMVFCAIVTQQAFHMIMASLKYGKVSATMLRVPMWLVQLPLLFGFLLLSLQFAIGIADRFIELKKSNAGKDEAHV